MSRKRPSSTQPGELYDPSRKESYILGSGFEEGLKIELSFDQTFSWVVMTLFRCTNPIFQVPPLAPCQLNGDLAIPIYK